MIFIPFFNRYYFSNLLILYRNFLMQFNTKKSICIEFEDVYMLKFLTQLLTRLFYFRLCLKLDR